MNSIGKYFDQDTGRTRWAVYSRMGVWYFPVCYGKRAAKRLADKLNRS